MEGFDSAYDFGIQLLKDLISIPTVSPSGEHYKEAADLLAETLRSLGFSVDVIEVDKNYQKSYCKTAGDKPRYIVLGRLGSGGTRLHINGHYDVVPGGPGWSVTEPFKPVIVDDKLYGRGAVDMKGGIAAAIAGVKAALDSGYSPSKLTLEMAFVPDEEIGGQCGTGYLVERVLDRPPELVLIPEPSGLSSPWHGHKGALWARVRVAGRTAHASTPWRGRNAFIMAARLALMLDQAFRARLAGRRTRYKITPPEAAVSTYMIGGVASVEGGKTNQVPGAFSFTIDRRLIPEETVDGAKAEIEDLLRWASTSLGSIEYSVDYLEEMEPVVSEPGRLFEALRTAGGEAGVEIGEPELCPGGLDLRYYLMRGSEGLAYGPNGELAHAPDEYIDLGEFRALVRIFAVLPRVLESMV
ncbi:MAG: M20 family metallopeptidase [Desulfurococcales archaeon]|nr:M20 family metallopeptidase [Desulfurococcales archaeon]